MNNRPATDPYGNPTKSIDFLIGNAFPVIKKVHDNLQDILYVAANLQSISVRDVELQSDNTTSYIQWRYVGETSWNNLVSYSDLLGADITAVIAEMNQLKEEIDGVSDTVLNARDQALQAVIDASNASRLSVGSVVEGELSVSITGDPGSQVLNLSIPKGDKGDSNVLTIGTVTEGSSAHAEITGTTPAQVLSLVLPRGTDGETPVFTVGTVETGTPGSSVEVTLTGSVPNFTLNFKIPQGATGAGTGDMLSTANLSDVASVVTARINLGLGNVNNTTDADKPISTATQTALNTKANSVDVTASLSNKVDKVSGYGLSTNDYTTAEKNKLASLNEHFKGSYASLAALQTAIPTATAGDYASVDAGAGSNVIQYLWDVSDNQWVKSGADIATTSDTVMEGSVNLYFKTDRVLNTVLAGLSLLTGTAVVNTDTIVISIGKLQKQITDFSTLLITSALQIGKANDGSDFYWLKDTAQMLLKRGKASDSSGTVMARASALGGLTGDVPAFRCFGDTNQSIAVNAIVPLRYNQTDYDYGTNLSVVSGATVFTVPVTGIYSIGAATVMTGVDSTYVFVSLQVNGTNVAWSDISSAAGTYWKRMSTNIKLNAGDVVRAAASVAGVANTTSSPGSNSQAPCFYGHLVRQL